MSILLIRLDTNISDLQWVIIEMPVNYMDDGDNALQAKLCGHMPICCLIWLNYEHQEPCRGKSDTTIRQRKTELLAPAKNGVRIAAVDHYGADVYLYCAPPATGSNGGTVGNLY